MKPGPGKGEGEAKGKQGDRCLAHSIVPQPACGDKLKCVLDDEKNPDVGGTCQPDDGKTQQNPPVVEPQPGTEGGACGFGARGRGGAIVPCGEGLVCVKGSALAPGVCQKQRGGGQWAGPAAGYVKGKGKGNQNGDGNGDSNKANMGDKCQRQGQDEKGTCAMGLVCKVDGTTENAWGVCEKKAPSGPGPTPNEGQGQNQNQNQQPQPGTKGSPCTFKGTPGTQQDTCSTGLVCGLADGASTSPCANPSAGCPGVCTEKKNGDGNGDAQNQQPGAKGSACTFTGTPGTQQDTCTTGLVCGLAEGASTSTCTNTTTTAGCPGICTEKAADGKGDTQNQQTPTPTGATGSACTFTGTPGTQQDTCSTGLVCGLAQGASTCTNPSAGCPGVCTEKKNGDGKGDGKGDAQNPPTPTGTGAKGSSCTFTGTPGTQQDTCSTNLVCGLAEGASPCTNPAAGCPGICTEKKAGPGPADGQGDGKGEGQGEEGAACTFKGTPGMQREGCKEGLVCGGKEGEGACGDAEAGCPGTCMVGKTPMTGGYA